MTGQRRKVRLASIGAGMIGKVHAGIMADMTDCTYVALSDEDPAKEELSRALGVPFYRDFRKMIEAEDLDGVVISVPNELHESVGTECAEHGLHIMMEKPIAASKEAAQKLIRNTRKFGVKLIIAHHRRFNPMIVATRKMIRNGDLGDLVGISVLWSMYKPDEYFAAGEWRKKKGGGPILINAIHEIDNLRFIYGEIERVYADVSNKTRNFEVEDTASFSVRFTDGVLASVLMSDTTPSLWSYEATMGENDFFFQTKGDIYHFLGRKASLSLPGMLKVYYPDPSRQGWQYPLATERLEIESRDPYPEQLAHFCRVIGGMEQHRTSGEDALRTLNVISAIRESAETGQSVTVDYT